MAINAIGALTAPRTADSSTQQIIANSDAKQSAAMGKDLTNSTTTTKSATTLDRDAFLKLLVAQLKYQDPSKPADPSEMISQSAQLSVVDQLDAIKQAITSTTGSDRLGLGASLIGKQIAFNDADGKVSTATVTSVSFANGTTLAHAGDWDVPLDAILGVAAAPATTPATGSTTTTGTTGSTAA